MMKPNVLPFKKTYPAIGDHTYIAPNAYVIGDVIIGSDCSIWFGAVLRGDVNYIRVGSRTNIQDNSVVHVTHDGNPTIIGDDVTIGHGVILHACTIGNRVLIGMGAIILDGVVIPDDSYVAAGSLVTPGKVFQSKRMIMGSPSKETRDLRPDELEWLTQSARHYQNVAKPYLDLSDAEKDDLTK
jgi:carbonic anhydrase/acetyltransferase-like protein (isoleucine patch superfamily)